MGDLLYPTIPDPIQTPESLLETAVALKQAVELLNGQRLGNGTTKAMTAGDLKYVFGTPLPPGAVPPPVDTSGVSAALAAARASVQLALLELRNTVENSIIDIENSQQEALTEFQLLLDQEEDARIDGDAIIQSQVDAIIITNNEGAIAAIATETALRIAGDTALAGQITTVSATVAGNTAAISSEAVTRASQDAALSTQINNVSAVATSQHVFTQSTPPVATQVGDIWIDVAQGNLLKVWDGTAWVARDDNRMDINAAAISTEQTVRADADVAIANQMSTITTQVDDNSAAITSEQVARADADDALAADIDTLETSVGSSNALIAAEALARSNADSALAGQINTVSTATNNNAAAITAETSARTNADTAFAGQMTTLSTTVAGHTSTITTQQGSLNGLLAEYSVTLNANGHIAGFNINSGGPTSNFIVQADKFQIASQVPGVLTSPFVVVGNAAFIAGATIQDGTITANELAANSVVAGKVAANAITAVAIAADAITTPKILGGAVSLETVLEFPDDGPLGTATPTSYAVLYEMTTPVLLYDIASLVVVTAEFTANGFNDAGDRVAQNNRYRFRLQTRQTTLDAWIDRSSSHWLGVSISGSATSATGSTVTMTFGLPNSPSIMARVLYATRSASGDSEMFLHNPKIHYFGEAAVRAFVIDNHTGLIKYTTNESALARMSIPDDETVVLSDKFDTAVPNVFWNFAIGDFEPFKDMRLVVVDGNRITNIPHGATVNVGGVIYIINDGELEIEGPEGATRLIVVKCARYMREIVSIKCRGYSND